MINGDTLDLPDGDSIKMFVGQVPKHLNETELRNLFEEFGRVYQINVLRDKVTKQSKGKFNILFYFITLMHNGIFKLQTQWMTSFLFYNRTIKTIE